MKRKISGIIVLLIISIHVYSQSNLDSGLVVYYQFENNVNDCSGNEYNGTIYGTPTYVSGINGLALDFDGVSDYVRIYNSNDLVLEDFTISAWVRWDGNPNVEGSWAIISNWYGGSNYQHYGLRMGTIGPGIPFNHPVIFYDDGTAWDWVYGNKEEASDGNWHNITGIVESGIIAKIYLDGYLVGEDDTSIPLQINPTGDLYIARDGKGDLASPVERWNGIIDEVRIYNRALSEEEVIEIYDDTPTNTEKIIEETGLINIYPNPTRGRVAIDLLGLIEPTVKIYTLLGQLILERTKIKSSSFEFQLDEAPGIYIVEIISEGKKRIFKLEKK